MGLQDFFLVFSKCANVAQGLPNQNILGSRAQQNVLLFAFSS